MYNFFPEKIYKALKDHPIYIKWDKYVNDTKKNTKTFKESLFADYDIKKSEMYKKYHDEISAIIKNKCPEYYTQYLLVNTELSKEDFLMLYNTCKYDTETTLYLISQLINTSYVDRDYAKYIKQYVITYQSILKEERYEYSEYCHLKYFTLAPEQYMLEVPKDELFLPTMMEYINSLRNEMIDLIDDDKLNHCYLQIVEHMIANAMYFLNNDKIVAQNLDDMNFLEDSLQTQYINYSCARAGIKDKKFEIYFSNREFVKAFKNMKWLFEYIDKALMTPEKFFKGLEYYDKINNYPMAAIVRRMLKVAEAFPEFGFKLNNLSSEDKEFLMSNNVSTTTGVASYVTLTTFGNCIRHMDDWLYGNKETIKTIRENPEYYQNIINEVNGL